MYKLAVNKYMVVVISRNAVKYIKIGFAAKHVYLHSRIADQTIVFFGLEIRLKKFNVVGSYSVE